MILATTTRRSKSSSSKLSSTEESSRVVARQRNRSLKKSQAVQDDEPTHHHQHNHHHPHQHPSSSYPSPLESRRAASFDTSQKIVSSPLPNVQFRPGSFDSGRSAFSPVEVPRLLVQSPLSPLQLDPPTTTDNRLLTVPSPDFRSKSPIVVVENNFRPIATNTSISYPCESTKNPEIFHHLNSLTPNILSQLSAAIATRPLGINSPLLDEFKINISNIPKLEQMDCSGSFETTGSAGSFDLQQMSAQSSFDHSTQSMTPATAEILAQMPPKSVIQDDIRNGNGRFQLVRKRGRSEVWNLFGQVLDNATNVRLPYVACYACKVLYTDTGGGTGNMTRHRCPIGASYRSSTHGSSTETVEAGGTNSFDSSVSATATNRTSMDTRNQLSISMTESTINQLVSQHSGENSIGDVDREVLTDAMVKCCALDLIDPAVFSGKGIRGLLWKISHISKHRVSPSPMDFPDVSTVQLAMQTNLRFCTDDLKNELSRTPQGVRLSLETLKYCGKEYRVIHGSRISPEWKWRSNILGVFKSRENESLNDMINIVIHKYELNRNLLRVTTCGEHNLGNIKTFIDVKWKIKEILNNVLSSCSTPVMGMLYKMNNLAKSLFEMDIRLPFSISAFHNIEDIFDIHSLLSDWNDQSSNIEQIIASKCSHLLPTFKSLDCSNLRELESFILPFRETIDSLSNEQPNFHKVLPEWFALMHECQVGDNEPSPLLRELRQKAIELLTKAKDLLIGDEHRISAILNPRLSRKLSMILTETERDVACEKIRAICGIRNPKEPLSRGSSCDGEPHRKRRMFLSSLEDDPVGDELECYLRSQYPHQQTKDVISFWSTIGQSQFPALASLARKTLSTPATAPVTLFDPRAASVSPDQLHTFLMLRSMFESEKDDEDGSRNIENI